MHIRGYRTADDLAQYLRNVALSLRITTRRMFGGWGIYGDGLFFGLIAQAMLWLKADALSDEEWDAAGCPRFTYSFGPKDAVKGGSMNYRRAPDDALDDPETMRHWATLALEAAARAAASKGTGVKPRRK